MPYFVEKLKKIFPYKSGKNLDNSQLGGGCGMADSRPAELAQVAKFWVGWGEGYDCPKFSPKSGLTCGMAVAMLN
jgi:hypothetical protein